MPKLLLNAKPPIVPTDPLAGADQRRTPDHTWVNTGTSLALERLARHNEVTKREMLERIVGSPQKPEKIAR